MRRSQKDNEESARRITRRALFLGGAQAAIIAALGVRLRHMQVEEADQYRLLAEENRVNIRLIPPARGLIHDRNGVIVAGNEQNYRIVIVREDAGDVEQALNHLRSLVALTDEDIDRTLREIRRRSAFVPITVAERLSWEDVARVAANAPALPGITPEVGLSRHYPFGGDYAHVVGYVGPVSENDLAQLESPDPVLQIPRFQIGKVGLETRLEDALRGKAGSRRIEVNAVGRMMRELDRQEGEPGASVQLTIDDRLQNFVQARLGLESAACVVMDVDTGDLLAISSSPSFDPNLFVRGIGVADYRALMDNDHRPLANKTVQGAYPPGSTFKMVTALAALEAGLVGLNDTVYCPGHMDVAGRRFHCWKRGGHGRVALVAALAESCDVYFYDIAQRCGIDRIAEMSYRLGLGQRHDLPMSAISEGLNPNRQWKRERHGQEWRVGDTVNASIGQGYVLSTPLQLAVMTARLASGRSVSPRLVRAINGVEEPIHAGSDLGLNPEFLREIRRGMAATVNSQRGTAYSSRVEDPAMRLAGKTGTSQVRNITAAERARGVVRNEQLPWNRRDHALFVGYAPAEAPRIAVSVVVEHGMGGSTAAAPIGRDVALFALNEGLPPLSAYPASQRTRIENERRELVLRLPETAQSGQTRA
ncbi:penicillin-binding protein 2 [Plastorhodobacter daqingensis]|uniref:Penicillin-binding protein 2 n=1 Tax=Plastorhodobacter daqingensis TaxID=1387281 RepID=A0ABW2UGW4_9RHOB